MKTAHMRAHELADTLADLVRKRPAYAWHDNWRAHVQRVVAELQAALLEADRDVADAFDARRVAYRKPCSWCGGPIPKDARIDATTCSKRCRQAKHRGGSGRKARIWPRGIRTGAPAGAATHATDVELVDETVTDATDAGTRRSRRARLSADDWRSEQRRAQREQLSIMAPPITTKGTST